MVVDLFPNTTLQNPREETIHHLIPDAMQTNSHGKQLYRTNGSIIGYLLVKLMMMVVPWQTILGVRELRDLLSVSYGGA